MIFYFLIAHVQSIIRRSHYRPKSCHRKLQCHVTRALDTFVVPDFIPEA